MRYLVGLAGALALVALPLGVSAQADEEPNSQEPSSEAAPEESALQLKLDEAGVEIVTSPPRTPDGYSLGETGLRAKHARGRVIGGAIGLGVSVGVLATGVWLFATSFSATDIGVGAARFVGGGFLIVGGSIGTGFSAAALGRGAQELRWAKEAENRKPRRTQWDLARSRLVF